MENDSSELASMIATFIKQNGHNRKKVTVVNYAHGFNGIYDIDIPVTSVNILPHQPFISPELQELSDKILHHMELPT